MSSKENKLLKIQHENEKLFVDCIIKYLYLYARFIIKEKIQHEFNMNQKSIKSKKSEINSKILKIYVDIIENNALNKIWIKLNRIYREMIESICFLQIFDKKKGLKIDWIDKNAMKFEIERQNYHFIDNFESKITQNQIWFTTNMTKKSERNATTFDAIRRHNR